jgi:hypothetical protein
MQLSASVDEDLVTVNYAKLLKKLMRPARLERATFWFVVSPQPYSATISK